MAERTPNELLRRARLAQVSSSKPDGPMSRQEVGEAVAAIVYRSSGRVVTVTAAYVGRLERGDGRWPSAAYRHAFRTVFGVDDDASLGFYTTGPGAPTVGPGKPPTAGLASMAEAEPDVDPEHISALRLDLGRQLAQLRAAANLSQAALARRATHPRATIAGVERGTRSAPRRFWEIADRVLHAEGVLLKAFDQLCLLLGTPHPHPTEPGPQRHPARPQVLPGSRPPAPDRQRRPAGPPQPTCGCDEAVVARWGWREVRALREALRLPVRAFAAHLGVAASAVAEWENRSRTGRLHLTTEDLLDQALRMADADKRARFVQLRREHHVAAA